MDAVNWGILIFPTVSTLVVYMVTTVIVRVKLRKLRHIKSKRPHKNNHSMNNSCIASSTKKCAHSGDKSSAMQKTDLRSHSIHATPTGGKNNIPGKYYHNTVCGKIPHIDVSEVEDPDVENRIVEDYHRSIYGGGRNGRNGGLRIVGIASDRPKMSDIYLSSCSLPNGSISGDCSSVFGDSYDLHVTPLDARGWSPGPQLSHSSKEMTALRPQIHEGRLLSPVSCLSTTFAFDTTSIGSMAMGSENVSSPRPACSTDLTCKESTPSKLRPNASPLSLGTLSMHVVMENPSKFDPFCTEYLTRDEARRTPRDYVRSGHTPCPKRTKLFVLTNSKIYPGLEVDNKFTSKTPISPRWRTFLKHVARKTEGKRSSFLIIIFVLCVMPVFGLIAWNRSIHATAPFVRLNITCLLYLHNMLNPCMYFLTSQRWREELRKVYYKFKRRAMYYFT